jgi:predicted ATPase
MLAGGGFVGRAVQLGELDAVLASASAGRGELVVVAGESGIGKTRFVHEVAERAREHGLQVGEAACWDGGAPVLWPWVQLVRDIAARSGIWGGARVG